MSVLPSPLSTLRRAPSGALRPLAGLLAVIALVLGMLAVSTAAASAASAATTGTITTGSPTSGIPQNDPETPCLPGTSAHYATVSFTVDISGGDTVDATVTPHGFRAAAAIFEPSYDPAAPTSNCVNDAVTGSASDSPITASVGFGPVSGTSTYSFELVVWGATASDVGSFDVSIASTGSNVVITSPSGDTTPPVVVVPGTITQELSSMSGNVISYAATANDDVDGALPTSCAPASGSIFPLGTTTVTCTATDTSGNQGSASFSVKIVDTTPPTIIVPADLTREATGPLTSVSFGGVTFSDIGGLRNPACNGPSSFPVGVTTITCTASDASGNNASKSFTVTIVDTTAPSLSAHGDVNAEATSASGAVVTYSAPTASDLVDGSRPVGCSPASGSTFPLGATQVTCQSTDAHGNTGTTSFTVSVSDTAGPVLHLPPTATAEATSPSGAVVTWTDPYAVDAVDGPVTIICSAGSGATFPVGTTHVTCSAFDHEDHGTSGSFDVVVRDTTAPTLSNVPSDQTLEATGPSGAVASWTDPTASDAVTAAPVVVCDHLAGTSFAIGSTTVSCTATDAAGNVATATFHVVVHDTTAPALVVPTARSAEATGPDGAHVSFTTSAVDLVDGAVTTSCDHASGDLFALGTTTVTCSAADTRGNRASASFDVTVADQTAPAITVPSVPSTEATGADGAHVTFVEPTATDAVDGTPSVTCDHASGDLFPLGTTTVSCSSTDAAGNTGTATFDVAVVDTTAPAIAALGDVTAEATSADGATVTYTVPAATDAVDGIDTVTCDPASGSTFALGTTTVTCTATDAAGNQAQKSFGITVSDTSAPVLMLPADVTAEATGPDGAAVDYDAPTATDAVDGVRPVSCDHDSGATYPLGATTVTCSASDLHGHTVTSHFTVTVADTTAPTVSVPSAVNVPAANRNGATASYSASATDVVDGPLPATCTPASGSHFPVGTSTVTCRATDAAGNTGTASFDVTVRGLRAPHITTRLSSSVSPGATGWYRAPVTVHFACTAGSAAVTACPAPVSLRGEGVHHVTRTVHAADGATATARATVKIDRTSPTITFRGATKGATYAGAAPTGVSCVPHDGRSGVTGCTLTLHRDGTTYRWTATARDRAGNRGKATLTYQVRPALFAGTATQDGHALVRAGHSYEFRVYAVTKTAPTYLAAAVEPRHPTPTPTTFRRAGGNWWTVRVTIDRGMTGRDWVVGARVGKTDYLVKLRVVR